MDENIRELKRNVSTGDIKPTWTNSRIWYKSCGRVNLQTTTNKQKNNGSIQFSGWLLNAERIKGSFG